jgi:hypothetical protein
MLLPMRVTRIASAAFTAEFESQEELRAEQRANLSIGAMRLPTAESVPLHTTLLLTLRGPWGGEVFAKGTVVATLPDGLALMLDGDADDRLRRLLERPTPVEEVTAQPELPEPPVEIVPEPGPETPEQRQNIWDRMRGLSQMEKLLLAVKADRIERALLLQDNDPRVLLSLLRNPRITIDEVVRLAKSTYLNFQIADVILKAAQWSGSLDVRLALIHNPKTPPPFALRILPTLPEAEVRVIARTGTNMALKQAALRRLQGKP